MTMKSFANKGRLNVAFREVQELDEAAVQRRDKFTSCTAEAKVMRAKRFLYCGDHEDPAAEHALCGALVGVIERNRAEWSRFATRVTVERLLRVLESAAARNHEAEATERSSCSSALQLDMSHCFSSGLHLRILFRAIGGMLTEMSYAMRAAPNVAAQRHDGTSIMCEFAAHRIRNWIHKE